MSSSPSTLVSPTAASSSASSDAGDERVVAADNALDSDSALSAPERGNGDADADDDDDESVSDWNVDVGNDSSSEGNWDEVWCLFAVCVRVWRVRCTRVRVLQSRVCTLLQQTLGVEQRAEPLRLVNVTSKARNVLSCVRTGK
jgi:hypothetical protein